MASGIFYPAASGDDGHWCSGSYSNTLSYLYLGNVGITAYNIFVRFPNINIPRLSLITSAFVRFTSHMFYSNVTLNENIYFNTIDNAVAPTTEGEANGLSLTGIVTWNNLSSWSQANQYDTPELKSILQAVIDRGGWNSGNAVQVILKDNSSTNDAHRYARAFDFYSGASKVELHVTWTPSVLINANITIPSIQTQGYTGIYSAPSIPMPEAEGLTGITAEPSISMLTVILTGSDNIKHIQATASIPMISANIVQAEQIWGDATIPSMVAELTERETVFGEVSIPVMTAELTSGIHADLEAIAPMMTAEGTFSKQCEVSLPMMAVELEGTVGRVINSSVKIPGMTVKVTVKTGRLADCDISIPMLTVACQTGMQSSVSFPMITVEAEGVVGRIIQSSVSIPIMGIEITGKTGHLVNCDVSAPMLRVSTKLMAGKLIVGTAEVPMTVADLTSYEDITGDIDTSISMIEAYMVGTAERAVCPILRYNDKLDCIGNITEEIPMIEVSLAEA